MERGREGEPRAENREGSAARDVRTPGAASPLILPEPFDGTSNWDDWAFHFENVAAVNGWDDADKLKWLRVRLTAMRTKGSTPTPRDGYGDVRGSQRGNEGSF